MGAILARCPFCHYQWLSVIWAQVHWVQVRHLNHSASNRLQKLKPGYHHLQHSFTGCNLFRPLNMYIYINAIAILSLSEQELSRTMILKRSNQQRTMIIKMNVVKWNHRSNLPHWLVIHAVITVCVTGCSTNSNRITYCLASSLSSLMSKHIKATIYIWMHLYRQMCATYVCIMHNPICLRFKSASHMPICKKVKV